MEDEIASTLTIEDIDFQRDSVRRILQGSAPVDAGEERIYGLKHGLGFISNRLNKITEHNIGKLYTLAIGNHLTNEDDKLRPGQLYRHDRVYIVGLKIEHAGLDHNKLPQYMAKLIDFISADHGANDLIKAAIIHFYFAYIHPYFDGNGRMARLLHLWYLVQRGYSSAMFVSFSNCVENSRRQYYKAFSLAEQNVKISGVMDITPFLVYYIENVYNKLTNRLTNPATTSIFQEALAAGRITSKEKDLWNYTLSVYGNQEFTTKQLERDFNHAAYATIRSFVLKFENSRLLNAQKYGNKVKYRVNQGFENLASDMAIME